MDKKRLEAFSDGVFAIAITILVLNITVENIETLRYELLQDALIALWPKIFSYIMTFMLIGLYWLGHHFYFERIKMVDGNIVLMNIIYLMLISFMPFPTFLLGKFPFGELTLTFYGCTLIATNLLSFILILYLHRNPHLVNDYSRDEFYKSQLPLFFWFNLAYIVGIAFAFYVPLVSYILYLTVLLSGIKLYVKRMNAEAKK